MRTSNEYTPEEGYDRNNYRGYDVVQGACECKCVGYKLEPQRSIACQRA